MYSVQIIILCTKYVLCILCVYYSVLTYNTPYKHDEYQLNETRAAETHPVAVLNTHQATDLYRKQ